MRFCPYCWLLEGYYGKRWWGMRPFVIGRDNLAQYLGDRMLARLTEKTLCYGRIIVS